MDASRRDPTHTQPISAGIFSRRRFIQTGAAAIGLSAFSGCTSEEAPRRPPNILFILADDLGCHQLSCYGSKYFQTPSLDAFAREGMRFTDAYAAAPICSPTRASLMTGKSPARLHLTNYIPGSPFPHAKLRIPEWTQHLPTKEITIAEMLSEQGYITGHFGKWHLNTDKDYAPGRPGDPGSQGFRDVLTTEKPDSDHDPCADAHNVERITEHAIQFLRANKNIPFFCYVSHNSIHRPELECSDLISKYAQKEDTNPAEGRNPVEAAMMERLDTSIGSLLKTVDELGLRENTLIVFFSDNGPLHGFAARKPFFGGKGDLYEGGIRVPMIVRWPGVVAPGSTSAEPVISHDFFPTFAAIAGVTPASGLDGVDIRQVLNGDGSVEREALYFHYPHYHRLSSDTPPMEHPVAPHGAIRQGRFKLIEWFEESLVDPPGPGAYSLYDLTEDPGESTNLAEAQPALTAELAGKLRDWQKRVGAQLPTINPDFDPARATWRHVDRS